MATHPGAICLGLLWSDDPRPHCQAAWLNNIGWWFHYKSEYFTSLWELLINHQNHFDNYLECPRSGLENAFCSCECAFQPSQIETNKDESPICQEEWRTDSKTQYPPLSLLGENPHADGQSISASVSWLCPWTVCIPLEVSMTWESKWEQQSGRQRGEERGRKW